MLEIYAETLERMGSVEPLTERRPDHAAERLRTEVFDLLITNIQMPEMSGLELVRIARAHSADTPVLVVTGYPRADTAQACRELGVADYLTKPFALTTLQEAVSRALGLRA